MKLLEITERVIVTQAQYYRAAPPAVLVNEFKKYLPSEKIKVTKNTKEAVNWLFAKNSIPPRRKDDLLVLVAGSFYVLGEVRKELFSRVV